MKRPPLRRNTIPAPKPAPVAVAPSEAGSHARPGVARHRFFKNSFGVCGIVLLGSVLAFGVWGLVMSDWSAGGQSVAGGGFDGAARLQTVLVKTGKATLITLAIALAAAGLSIVIGTLWGLVAGFAGGQTDRSMMGLVDMMMPLPGLFILFLLLAVTDSPLWLLVVGIGLLNWAGLANLTRRRTLSIASEPYVEAALAAGVRRSAVLRRHVLPNLLPDLVIHCVLLLPHMILVECLISFLGLGVQPPLASLGGMIASGLETLRGGALLPLAAALAALVASLFAFRLIGHGLANTRHREGH